jgi:hypothetical protein
VTLPVHPEATADEVWICNMFTCDFVHVGWSTKRLGKQSYERSGKPITTAGFRPVFVARAELEAAAADLSTWPVDHRW